ncbi:hypothetical protein ANCCAN_08441 [Ancylostoma caninum]|uniref:Uncharacterized protein n=1 Tax=Ancylostoma caninum TaxID=29170 RepID=A0A368GMA2_ANCCA|nr:hypothetical protein ANCCAN_08441 [Ancylostoma caninum]
MQLFMLVLMGLTYLVLEKHGYFLNVDAFRPVVACIATLYAGGAIFAIIGVSTEKKALVNAHITIVTALMVFTDIIAISIVLTMAIGNRNKLTYSLPGHFVDERKFYAVLGPFWMYLGAITLHITVAVNMCFLQVLNSFISFLDEKMTPTGSSLDLKQSETKMKLDEIPRN